MVDSVNITLLGEHLRRVRQERKLRLRQVHDKTGISVASLSRIERGGSHGLDTKNFLTLCEWMKLPVEMFKHQPEVPARLKKKTDRTPDIVELHLRADRKLDKKTADALAMMFRTAYERFARND